MSILEKLINTLTNKNSLRNLVLTHWKPKLICLVLAIMVWMWMEFRYVRNSEEWENADRVFLSVPDADF